jgi:hypothetical protein
MAAQEERLAILETTVSEHTQVLVDLRTDLRESVIRLENRIDVRFDRLDDKMSRQFLWLVSMQITVLLAVIGSLLSIVAVLAPE